MRLVGEVLVRSGRRSGSSAPAATATARYTEYEPACVPITLRWPLLVPLPTSGRLCIGSSAPQTIGTGCGPCERAWVVSTMALGCFFFGRIVLMASFLTPSPQLVLSSRHPVRVRRQRPLGGDLLQVAPELDAARAGHVALAELGGLGAAEGERIARHRHADVDADHAARGALGDVAGDCAAGGEDAERVAVFA